MPYRDEPHLSVAATDLTPALLRTMLLDHGCLLMRGAVPARIMGPLSAAALEMMAHYDAIPPDVIEREMANDAPAGDFWRSVWGQLLNHGTFYNYNLITFTRGRHSLFEVVRDTGLQDIVAAAFPEMAVTPSRHAALRRAFGDGVKTAHYSDAPLSPHIDTMVHEHLRFGINFWTPLTNAGINEPGLAMVPLGLKETLDYLEYNPDGYPDEHEVMNLRYYRYAKFDPALLQDKLGFWMPEMRPGDILAFTTCCIHATDTRPKMTGRRVSIEARLSLGTFDTFLPSAA